MADNNKTVEQMCVEAKNPKHTCNQCAFTVCPSINKIVDSILAAHKRELAEKDALIKKLADALKKIDDACDGDMCKHFIDNKHCSKCVYLATCQTGIAHNALETNKSEIAKSLEVVNG